MPDRTFLEMGEQAGSSVSSSIGAKCPTPALAISTSSDRIDMIRDLFVFCCYTGLTYVDVINLEHDNIVEASGGESI